MTGYRILVADDEDLARSSLTDYLVLTGYEVISAANGREAVEKARLFHPDVVLLDVQMPGSDGFEALTLLRDDPVLKDTPVLLVTSLSRSNVKVRALDLGADDYIVKPFDRAELVARVRRALKRSARYRELSEALKGDLAYVSLAELLQTLELGRKTGRVLFPDLSARIHVVRGHFRSAQWQEEEGLCALCRLLLVPRGPFQVEFESASPLAGEEEPGKPIQEVILECARLQDEALRELLELGIDRPVEASSAFLGDVSILAPPPAGPLLAGELVARIRGDLASAARLVAAGIRQGTVRLLTK